MNILKSKMNCSDQSEHYPYAMQKPKRDSCFVFKESFLQLWSFASLGFFDLCRPMTNGATKKRKQTLGQAYLEPSPARQEVGALLKCGHLSDSWQYVKQSCQFLFLTLVL